MMKKKKQRLLIPFSGLKEGKHQFDFQIGAEFFEQFDQSMIDQADINVAVDFEKKKNLLEVDLSFEGTIDSSCDRCSDPVQVELADDDYVLVKFGEEESNDEHIIYIPDSAHELDLSDLTYELVCINLPAKIAHESEEDCDQEMIKKLQELSIENKKEETEGEVDPRWADLAKLKGK